MALAVAPSIAHACQPITSIENWVFGLHMMLMTLLLLVVWVGGRKVWIGQLGFVVFSGAATYVEDTYGQYFVEYQPLSVDEIEAGNYILMDGCIGEMYASIPVLFATGALFTLGFYCAVKPLWKRLPSALPNKPADTWLWVSAFMIAGAYASSMLLLAVRVVST